MYPYQDSIQLNRMRAQRDIRKKEKVRLESEGRAENAHPQVTLFTLLSFSTDFFQICILTFLRYITSKVFIDEFP
jgi:hypothetical protein